MFLLLSASLLSKHNANLLEDDELVVEEVEHSGKESPIGGHLEHLTTAHHL